MKNDYLICGKHRGSLQMGKDICRKGIQISCKMPVLHSIEKGAGLGYKRRKGYGQTIRNGETTHSLIPCQKSSWSTKI